MGLPIHLTPARNAGPGVSKISCSLCMVIELGENFRQSRLVP
jgi:hypothetical protein